MSTLHTEALTADAKELFPLLSHFRETFYLAGGTSLALQIGHRMSVDFDLFSHDPIKKSLLARAEAVYAPHTLEVLVNNTRELTFLNAGVKHTFLHYPFTVLLPFEKNPIIDLLSLKEILATKAYSIGRRGSFKDYVDLYVGLSKNIGTLEDIIALARDKYDEKFNDRLFLEQLLYLDDVPETAMVMLNRRIPTRQELVDFFTKATTTLRL